jgi:nickel transport protein
MVRVDAAGKRSPWRPAALWGALALALFLGAAPAQAHRVLVFAYAEGETTHVEAKFVPDTPVRQGKVLVLAASDGRELLSGTTDDQGKFSFRIPAAAAAQRLDLKIVVEAGLGHRGEWLLKADAYLPKAAAAPAPPAAPASPAPGAATGAPRTPAALEAPELEALLNRALERQLAPVKEMLAQLTVRRTTLPDILGGIGYILGFFGLWAYFQSRGKKNP